MEDKQEKSYPSGKIMFYSMDEQTLPCHVLTSPLPDLAAKAGFPSGLAGSAAGQAHRQSEDTVTWHSEWVPPLTCWSFSHAVTSRLNKSVMETFQLR